MSFEKCMMSTINVFCDNQSAIELSRNAVYHKRSKHIDISYHFTHEFVEKKKITIRYLQTSMIVADVFKALPRCGYLHGKCEC